jgi:3-hydroxy-9,10-secoandrosta-1,3,5(10)-triene-9,17-dione monooxygenase
MTRDELLRRASGLVPVFKERAARTEELRQIPGETVNDLKASGLIRIGNPPRYGGWPDVDMDAAYEVGWELGRGCGSTAWCYCLWAVHNWWVGHFPEKAQDEYYASGPDTLFSSGLNPAGGKAEPIDGGFRLSGRWGFSSGCDAAGWAMVAVLGPGRPGLTWLLLPRADYEIVDTWFASGLRGSGSKDIAVQDAFVPAHRTLNPDRAGAEDQTGWELHRRLSYRVPLRCIVGWDLVSPLVGIAQGAVDEFSCRLRGTSGPGRTAESVPVQMRLAEAAAEVDAGRTVHAQVIRGLLDRAARGEAFTEMDRARSRRDKAFVVKLCVQAVNRLFEASGAHSVLAADPMQRLHRDAHSLSHHAALGWDVAAEQFGRVALGLPPTM